MDTKQKIAALENIPDWLKGLRQWVNWELANDQKIPISPEDLRPAKSNDSKTWGHFLRAWRNWKENPNRIDGVGFVFSPDDELCGIDLDNCRDPETGELEEWAQTMVDDFETFTEISQSGRGLHILLKGVLPDGKGVNQNGIEVYDRGRYFIMTGDVLDGKRYVRERQGRLDELMSKLKPTGNKNEPGWFDRLLDEGVPEGQRDDAATRLAGEMMRRCWSVDKAVDRIDEWNRTKNRPPSPDLTRSNIMGKVQRFCDADAAKKRVKPQWVDLGQSVNFGQMQEYFRALARGMGMLFVEKQTDRYVYDKLRKQWYRFVGHYWVSDTLDNVFKLVATLHNDLDRFIDICENRIKHGDDSEEKEAKTDKAIALNLKRCLNKDTRLTKEILEFASKGEETLAIEGTEWDQHEMQLAVANGIVDLRTGELIEGAPEQYVKNFTDVEWAGLKAKAPTWERFMSDVFGGDLEMVEFMQAYLGYAITGTVKHHYFPILWGVGRNGKTTMLEARAYVLGHYAGPINTATLMVGGKHGVKAGEARPDLMSFQGKRLVWGKETEQERKLNVAEKALTGADTIIARQLYKGEVSFKPTHTLFLMSNYRPHIGNEQAMWDRVLLIGFEQRFVDRPKESEYQADKERPDKLRAEAPGILAWLVRGAINYQDGGLKIPEKGRADTEKYRQEDDFIARFIADCCVEAGNAKVKSSVIHAEYEKWAEKNKQPELTNQALSQELVKRGYRKKARRDGKWFFSVGLESDYGSRVAAIEEEGGTDGIPF